MRLHLPVEVLAVVILAGLLGSISILLRRPLSLGPLGRRISRVVQPRVVRGRYPLVQSRIRAPVRIGGRRPVAILILLALSLIHPLPGVILWPLAGLPVRLLRLGAIATLLALGLAHLRLLIGAICRGLTRSLVVRLLRGSRLPRLPRSRITPWFRPSILIVRLGLAWTRLRSRLRGAILIGLSRDPVIAPFVRSQHFPVALRVPFEHALIAIRVGLARSLVATSLIRIHPRLQAVLIRFRTGLALG